ncbi:MAG: cation:proton antiporter [Chitinophagaceae bacterium]|nr:cation:proton antiporter [Anaerolineae bacterium]
MSEVIQFFLALGVLITLAKTFGYIGTRFGQPSVLGELIAGVIIGPSILNLLHLEALFPDGASVEHTITEIAELGVLLLMFSAGLEIDLDGLAKVGRTAVVAGVSGVIVPIFIAAPIALLFGYTVEKAIFIGLILAATSVSISAQVMLELGVLRTREGLALLGAAIVDDVLVILLMSLFIAIDPGQGAPAQDSRSVLEVILRLIGFLTFATGLSWFVLPWIARHISKTSISSGTVIVAVVSALLFGVGAEYFGGVAAITGAFIAGVGLSRADRRIKEKIEVGLHSINYGMLVPIFFVSIGLHTNLRLLDATILPFAVILTLGAIASKIIGAGAGGLLTGFDRLSSLRLGMGMISRGEVGLIIATLGITNGIINQETFAAIVLVVLVTTIITPPLVRWSFAQSHTPQTEKLSTEGIN